MPRLNRYARSADTAAVVAAMSGARAVPPAGYDDGEPTTLRRWSAVDRTRINNAHWARARGDELNVDIARHMTDLQARCAYERSRNPILDGVISTFASDVVGCKVTLQVQSDSERYNRTLEEAWHEFFARPDVAGVLSGVELLQLAISQLFDAGDILLQRRSVAEPTTLVAYRVRPIDAATLKTNPTDTANPDVVAGVRRNSDEVPVAYTLHDSLRNRWITLDAEQVIHAFRVLVPGQARGVPWSAVPLESLGQLRDFDQETLNAARAAAKFGVVFTTNHPDAPFRTVKDEIPIDNFVMSTAPPGYEPQTIQSHHPGPEYVPFRHERLREVGRTVCMPLMKILLGSERHNFASARMDAKNYERFLGVVQKIILEHKVLLPMLADVVTELMLVQRRGQFVLPRQPRNVRYVFGWAKQPATDPVKEATAEAKRLLDTRTLTFAEACAANETDEDSVLASTRATLDKVRALGLEHYFTFLTPQERQALASSESLEENENRELEEATA